jgi:hypothetical protein
MLELCPPSIINIVFSLTYIITDMIKGLYNSALIKFIIMIIITLLLQILCNKGLAIISWFIVFIPFILMTLIVSILLYIFGLNATTGNINSKMVVQPPPHPPSQPPPPLHTNKYIPNTTQNTYTYLVSNSPEYKS